MTTIFKKVIISPLKKVVNWYLTQMSKTSNYICLTGTFPQEYYEMMWEQDKKRNKSK